MTTGNIEVKITLKDDAKELLDICKDVAELRTLIPGALQQEASVICERISQRIKQALKLETP